MCTFPALGSEVFGSYLVYGKVLTLSEMHLHGDLRKFNLYSLMFSPLLDIAQCVFSMVTAISSF